MINSVLKEKYSFLTPLCLWIIFYQLNCSSINHQSSISALPFVLHQMPIICIKYMHWEPCSTRPNNVFKRLFSIGLYINRPKLSYSCSFIIILIICRRHLHDDLTANIFSWDLINTEKWVDLTFQRYLQAYTLNSLSLSAKYTL